MAKRKNSCSGSKARPRLQSPAIDRKTVCHRIGPALVVMEGENPVAFQMLADGIDAEFEPKGPMAAFLVDYAATLLWRLRRVATFEAGLLTWIAGQQRQRHDRKGIRLGDVFLAIDGQALPLPGRHAGAAHRQQHGLQVIGRTLESALDKSDPLGKIGRYEGHLMRQLMRTLEELRRLRVAQKPMVGARDGTDGNNASGASVDGCCIATPMAGIPAANGVADADSEADPNNAASSAPRSSA